ncbi:hypothetical protein [Acidomonas methanolica]|uniref:hypothetical protein n=1 Tax=Acidomonas methanolica TaxID=437 RepID=UPI00211A8B3C|nr:hypothetical protein [Acidomonas methanolica]MCQ9154976.1 hypothetical protein [Acidomonas methanolica]
MTRRTIITYHSLEASGSSNYRSAASQNLSANSFSQAQHDLNRRDHVTAAIDDADPRARSRPAAPLVRTGGQAPDPRRLVRPLDAAIANARQAERVVDHVSFLRGTADRNGSAVDDLRLRTMLRSAPRATYGRDADLTVIGEGYLDDPSYIATFRQGGLDPRGYRAEVSESPNRKTSNGFSFIDGCDESSSLNFSSRASFVGSGRSFLVLSVNDLVAAFIHTPNAIANKPAAGGFYSDIVRNYHPDIVMGDTNERTSIAPRLGAPYAEFPRTRTPAFARPADFNLGMMGTNSTRKFFYDQIVYNTQTTEIESARYIPSDISGATMSDHFGLILCARKKTKRTRAEALSGPDLPGAPQAKRRRLAGWSVS